MEKVSPMVDMANSKDDTEGMDCMPSASSYPKYPWGLCLNLCEKEMEKLGIDFSSLETGDILHFHSLAVVISKSSNETQDGDPHYSVSLQITHMSGESEDEENQMASKVMKKLYKGS